MNFEANDRMHEGVESSNQIIQQWNQMLNATDEKTVDLRLAATGEMVEVMTPS
jgi:hypothetical protein